MKILDKPRTLLEVVPLSTQGIALDVPPEALRDGEHLAVLNGLIRGGRVTPRPALTLLNSFTEPIVGLGTLKAAVFDFDKAFVITTKRLWQFEAGVWTEIKQTYSDGTISVAQDESTVTGSDTKWLYGPDPIHPGDEITFNGETKVIASVTSDTELTLAAPAEHGWTGGYSIQKFLTGGETDFFSWTVFQDKLYFVQGVDVVKVWDGGASYTYEDVMSGDKYSCKYLTTWADRLILLHTKEGGVWQRRRMRWCARATPGSALDWTGDGSGAVDLLASQGELTAAKPLGGRLVIYKTDSISLAQETGQVIAPIEIAQSVVMVGCVAPFSLEDVGGMHVFAGVDGVYVYDMSRPEVATKKIDYGIMFMALNLKYCLGTYDPATRNYWLVAGRTSDPASSNFALVALDVRTGSWTLHIPWVTWFAPIYGIACVGAFPGTLETPTIDELPGTIDSLPQPIDTAGKLFGASSLVVARSDYKLYISDPNAVNDYESGNWNVGVFLKWLNFGAAHVHKTIKRAKARIELFGTPVEATLKVVGGSGDTIERVVQLSGSESTVVFDLWLTDYVFKPELYVKNGQFALNNIVFEAEERGWGQ